MRGTQIQDGVTGPLCGYQPFRQRQWSRRTLFLPVTKATIRLDVSSGGTDFDGQAGLRIRESANVPAKRANVTNERAGGATAERKASGPRLGEVQAPPTSKMTRVNQTAVPTVVHRRHRICASYPFADRADMPRRHAELPRSDGMLATVVSAHPRGSQ